MKKLLVALALATVMGCGGIGKQIDPVVDRSPYDASKSCEKIESELATASDLCGQREKAVFYKNANNAMAAGLGFIFILPAVMIDPTSTDNINYENAVSHYNYLLEIAKQNGCQTGGMEPIVANKTEVP